jgi:hypothetical protein
MKNSFRKAFTIFKYLSIIFTVAFWIYMVNDDYVFIEEYGITFEGIGLWFLWFFGYFLAFTFYFWIISSAIILIYHKLIKRTKVS